jgi:hypothetical protein
VSTRGLRLAAGERDVDVSDDVRGNHLVDGKALAHRLDAAERSQQGWKALLRDAEDLEVDVLGWVAAEAIADPSADDQRASAGVAGGDGDATRGVQQCHESIIGWRCWRQKRKKAR